MTQLDNWEMRVLLVGVDAALLEGLAQSFAAHGYQPRVVSSLAEARDVATRHRPLLVVADQTLAAQSSAETAAVPLLPGGALIVFRTSADERIVAPPTIQRLVLAELTLPLERNRLFALAQHVHDRVLATGRTRRVTPTEQRLVDN